MVDIPAAVLLDSCFVLALLDQSDSYHKDAEGKLEKLAGLRMVMPWPVLYEVVRTRFVGDHRRVADLKHFADANRAFFLNDCPYRDKALDMVTWASDRQRRRISLVDMVIRCILQDSGASVRIHGLVTFNVKDFADVCRAKRIEMI